MTSNRRTDEERAADEAAIRALQRQMLEAWDVGDGEAFAVPFSDDALFIGFDGSVVRGYPSRMQVAERAIGYRRYGVTGRHIVDTWILAQLYDVGARDLESYGLKDVARHFAVAAPDRTYLPPEEIPRIFVEDPARLMAYARDDVLETLAISAILSPPYFVQAQALPFDYQTTVLRGNATKIDALLMREYLHRRQAAVRVRGVERPAEADLGQPEPALVHLVRIGERDDEELRARGLFEGARERAFERAGIDGEGPRLSERGAHAALAGSAT